MIQLVLLPLQTKFTVRKEQLKGFKTFLRQLQGVDLPVVLCGVKTFKKRTIHTTGQKHSIYTLYSYTVRRSSLDFKWCTGS